MMKEAVLAALLACTPVMAGDYDEALRTYEPSESFAPYLTVYYMGLGADLATTQYGLNNGLSEGNPLLSGLEDDAVVPVGLALGVLVGEGLRRLHRTHPRTARTIAIVSFFTHVYAAKHNYDVIQEHRNSGH